MEKRIQPPKLIQLTEEPGAYCDPVAGECFPANLQVNSLPLEKKTRPTGSVGESRPEKKTE